MPTDYQARERQRRRRSSSSPPRQAIDNKRSKFSPDTTNRHRDHRDRSRNRDKSHAQRHSKPHSRHSRSRSRSPRQRGSRRDNDHHSRHKTSHSLDRSTRHHRSHSPTERHSRPRHTSRSPSPKHHQRRRSRPRSRSPIRRSKPLPSQSDSYALTRPSSQSPGPPKEQANFAPSGLLAKEANTVAGTNIVLKYHEPPDARKPPASADWRLFVFKGDDEIEPPVPLAEQSCWLFGREKVVTDVWVQHPSASKQHAVIQFRAVQKKSDDEFAGVKKVVRPYVIDLESSNGTWLNKEMIPAKRFIEVRSGDVLRIGKSERDYVFMLPPKE